MYLVTRERSQPELEPQWHPCKVKTGGRIVSVLYRAGNWASEKINIYLPKVTWLIKVDSVGLVSNLRLVPVLLAAYLFLSKNSTVVQLACSQPVTQPLEGGQGMLTPPACIYHIQNRKGENTLPIGKLRQAWRCIKYILKLGCPQPQNSVYCLQKGKSIRVRAPLPAPGSCMSLQGRTGSFPVNRKTGSQEAAADSDWEACLRKLLKLTLAPSDKVSLQSWRGQSRDSIWGQSLLSLATLD